MTASLFDRSLLPAALGEFVVVADTHYMLEGGAGLGEFPSRGKQSQRAASALRLVAALEPDFVVHMGDVVQEYPETDGFVRAQDQALEQMAACRLAPHWVAGNHDVGDKPDPTMPTHPVGAAGLEQYHQRFGPSWYSLECGELHLVVLNSQILNTGLEAEARQKAWLEADLAAHAGQPTAVFLHLPPYLYDPGEAHLGHYDNIGAPARIWLLDLFAAHSVDWLFAAHVHFAFCPPAGATDYRIVPSTSFTRPGFSHLFQGAPPPEQGRDDTPKLGFFLCRLRPDRLDIHLIRSGGAEELAPGPPRLLTPMPADLPGAPLALTATHPLAWEGQVPLAYPSLVRQQVRNDYPLLACVEVGAQVVRQPWTDLQRAGHRVGLLRRQGVAVQATLLGDVQAGTSALEQYGDQVDTWEIQIAGGPDPAAAWLDWCRGHPSLNLALAPVIPGQPMAGKQHPRTRVGFRPDEMGRLNDQLQEADLSLGAVGRLDAADPWGDALVWAGLPTAAAIRRLDLLFELPGRSDGDDAARAAEALFATALLPGTRLFVEPLVDLDRTMDVGQGLLDPLCNPRPVFGVLRCLNALLQRLALSLDQAASLEGDGVKVRLLRGDEGTLALVLPEAAGVGVPAALEASGSVRLYHLVDGTVAQVEAEELSQLELGQPSLIVSEAGE
ncbi:MAG: hypothetical protein GKR89_06690 [Candidatus Latescibacteria bacterium]|nr:hypothetical protein [Candidatus Latescibacterota bacterium]